MARTKQTFRRRLPTDAPMKLPAYVTAPLDKSYKISGVLKVRDSDSISKVFKAFKEQPLNKQFASTIRSWIAEREASGIALTQYNIRFKNHDDADSIHEHPAKYFIGNLKYAGFVNTSRAYVRIDK